MQEPLFTLPYEIDGEAITCEFRRAHKEDETFYVLTANINGTDKNYELHIDYENEGRFSFTSEDVPKELLESVDEISDSIFEWDTFTAGGDAL